MRIANDSILLAIFLLTLGGIAPRACFAWQAGNAAGDPVLQEQLEFFEAKIRPVLISSCLDCHASDTEASGELVLDSRDGWASGGSSGPAIVPGESPESSLLIKAIRYDNPHLQMPPDGRLPEAVIADFERWVAAGAVDPRTLATTTSQPAIAQLVSKALPVERAQEHWAYRPVELDSRLVGQLPSSRVIDDLIERSLAEAALRPMPAAAPQAVVRRLFFDLTGLPPAPEVIAEFLACSDQEQAYVELVDRLLASPRFGETMARRWMDVVRYADSITLRGTVFQNAWRYRDYLVTAFNEDRSFATMIDEQVAGDQLETATDVAERHQQLIATTFWTMGNTNLEQQDKTQLEMDYIDEQLDVLGKAFLGQTISCARCHDHKFDPIPTSDYYALAGILRSAAGMDHENVSRWIDQPLPLEEEQQGYFDELAERRKALENETKSVKSLLGGTAAPSGKQIDVKTLAGTVVDNSQAKLIGEWTTSASVAPFVGQHYAHDGNSGKGVKSATFEPVDLKPGNYIVRMTYSAGANRASNVAVQVFSADGEKVVIVNQRQPATEDGAWYPLGEFRFEKDGQAFVMISNADTNGHVIVDAIQFLPLDGVTAGATKLDDPQQIDPAADKSPEPGRDSVEETRKILDERLRGLEAELKQIDRQLAARPKYMTIVERTEPRDIPVHVRGDVHNLGKVVPRGFLTALGHASPRLQTSTDGRLQLARWLSDDANPLTARVYANRVWTWIMGQGLVTSVDNFGTTGVSPSHPELLDWLATELVRSNWSTKQLIRQIVLSDAYRRSISVGRIERQDEVWQQWAFDAAMAIDPQNRLLWRGNERRLSVEALRDSMLMISGELDYSMGGSPVPPGLSTDYDVQSDSTRRSLYQPVFRNSLPQLYEAFDFANPSAPMGQRPRSTVATQSLELMNHPWVRHRAEAAARRFSRELDGENGSQWMQLLCRHCFARSATQAELELAEQFLRVDEQGRFADEDLATLIHALFAALDFRYLD